MKLMLEGFQELTKDEMYDWMGGYGSYGGGSYGAGSYGDGSGGGTCDGGGGTGGGGDDGFNWDTYWDPGNFQWHHFDLANRVHHDLDPWDIDGLTEEESRRLTTQLESLESNLVAIDERVRESDFSYTQDIVTYTFTDSTGKRRTYIDFDGDGRIDATTYMELSW